MRLWSWFKRRFKRGGIIAVIRLEGVIATGGRLEKYGLDYESLRIKNSGLIYCSITGFGQNGPFAALPGYDFIIQAMGGIMDLTGDPFGPPMKPGVAYADLFTSLYSVVAIQSALLTKQKNGAGTFIDMSLFDTQLAVLANQASSFLLSGNIPKRMGNSHPSIVPYQAFEFHHRVETRPLLHQLLSQPTIAQPKVLPALERVPEL